MKKKKLITLDTLKEYFKANNINQQELFDNWQTKEGQKSIEKLILQFTDSTILAEIVYKEFKMDDGQKVHHKYDIKHFKNITSLEQLVDRMNNIIESHNIALNRFEVAKEILGNLNREQQAAFDNLLGATQEVMGHLKTKRPKSI